MTTGSVFGTPQEPEPTEEDNDWNYIEEDGNWADDIHEMHTYYGHGEVIRTLSPEKLKLFLKFRLDFLQEEMTELTDAIAAGDPEEIVDACIDLCVVAIGTIDAFDVDVQRAWLEVLKANMAKQNGIKEGRPNPLGLPDLIKPEGWIAPSHLDNHGFLPKAFEE